MQIKSVHGGEPYGALQDTSSKQSAGHVLHTGRARSLLSRARASIAARFERWRLGDGGAMGGLDREQGSSQSGFLVFDVTDTETSEVRNEILDAAAVTGVNLVAVIHRAKSLNDDASKLELGLIMGHMYVVMGHMVDHGLVNQRDVYQGRLQTGESMAKFIDRFPLERNVPDIEEVLRSFRRTEGTRTGRLDAADDDDTANKLPKVEY